MAKGRTEKFLIEYNKTTDKKCLLVSGDSLEKARSVLGIGAHHNYIGWMVDWQKEYSDPIGMDKMFHFASDKSTEFVLFTACQLSLSTLSFISSKIGEISVPLGPLKENAALEHYKDDQLALEGIGKTAALMLLMLIKLMNRNKPHFDPEVHF
jgi:hypothetical protein